MLIETDTRAPTPRELAYLTALAQGERRPGISGQAGHMCRRFGWCETLYVTPAGEWIARSDLEPGLDSIAAIKRGYRAEGFVLTGRGRAALEAASSHAAAPAA